MDPSILLKNHDDKKSAMLNQWITIPLEETWYKMV